MLRLITAALLLAASPALAEGCRPENLRFAPGTSGAVVEGGLVRTEFACYALTARAGQRLEASVTSAENNAVFQIYAPGWRMRDNMAEGPTLPGAGEGEDTMRFAGTLPANGRYLVVVGGTRGNTAYRLRVTIK